jgi:hypothetical protein
MTIERAAPQWFPEEGIFLEGDYSAEGMYFTLAESDLSTAVRKIDHNTTDHQFVRQYIGDKTGVRVLLSLNDTSGLDAKFYYWDLRKTDGTLLANGTASILRGVRDPNNGQVIPQIPSVTVIASAFQVGDLFRVTQVSGANTFEAISPLELAVILKPYLDAL